MRTFLFFLSLPLFGSLNLEEIKNFQQFHKTHANHSPFTPLVARYTDQRTNLEFVHDILKKIHDSSLSDEMKEWASFEILAKIIAYLPLEKGDLFSISTQGSLIDYTVEETLVFNPPLKVFSLRSSDKSIPSILLFSGSQETIDVKNFFVYANEKEHAAILEPLFLKDKHSLLALIRALKSVRLVGFSSGGYLAQLTLLYYSDLLEKDPKFPCYLFSPLPLNKKQTYKYHYVQKIMKPSCITFYSAEDHLIIPSLTLGDLKRVSGNKKFGPYNAHLLLFFIQKHIVVS